MPDSPATDRQRVLDRIRASLASGEAAREELPLPPVMRAAGLDGLGADVFLERLRATGATVFEVPDEAGAGAAVQGILDDLGAATVAVSDGDGALASVASFGGEILHHDAEKLDVFRCDAGVSGVYAAVAETATLVLSTATERNRLTSLIPEVHIALLRRDQIVPTLDHVFERFGGAGAPPPRCITFITGPSRTADIELELVVGVHGPKALYVVLID